LETQIRERQAMEKELCFVVQKIYGDRHEGNIVEIVYGGMDKEYAFSFEADRFYYKVVMNVFWGKELLYEYERSEYDAAFKLVNDRVSILKETLETKKSEVQKLENMLESMSSFGYE
jgi:hypothetical protein